MHLFNRTKDLFSGKPGKIYVIILIMPLLFIKNYTQAAISFEDVSEKSGIFHQYSTAASAWGDLNGDGWPDLWVSNHWHQPPSLYMNMKDGTFVDVAADVLTGTLPADFHGAAWADFDNDGDQDLFVTTGGGGGQGRCPNYLFINHNDRLEDKAAHWGLDYPFGRGRTPLWFDADNDGKLDLLLMNRYRNDGKSLSAVFLQSQDRFVNSNEKVGFNPLGERTRLEKLSDLFENLKAFRKRRGPGKITPFEVFAQLSDLSGNHRPDLVSYVKPMRVYQTTTIPFKEITNDIVVSSVGAMRDAAIEDLDGDGKMDIFLARSHIGQGVSQPSPLKLQGRLVLRKKVPFGAVHFASEGEVTFSIYTIWIDPSAPQKEKSVVRIGNGLKRPIDGEKITLSPADPSWQNVGNMTKEDNVTIEYDPQKNVWTLTSFVKEINFQITAEKPIYDIKLVGFHNTKVALTDFLLTPQADGYRSNQSAGFSDLSTAAVSVVTGDFDNDMDVDIYLVCADQIQNLPNMLYENDGKGRFKRVDNAGGAKGSPLGRGNQVITADYDRDGFLDLFVTNGAGQPPIAYEGPHQLFRNIGNTNNWIEIDLCGTQSNRDGIGALISLEAGGKTQKRIQSGGIHSYSQNHGRLHFGLGANTTIDRIAVRWPSGISQELKNIPSNQIILIKEPGHSQ